MNQKSLARASTTLLAVAACITAAGGSPIDILAAARYTMHAALRLPAEESLSVIAHEWRAPAPAPAVDLAAECVPWWIVHVAALDDASETLREMAGVRSWTPGAFIAAAAAAIDALRGHLNAVREDPKAAVGLYVLVGRL